MCGWGGVTGFRPDRVATRRMMNVDERIRFLLRTAIRAEGRGDLRIARLFRRMAEELRTGEGVLSSADGPVLGAFAD